ncbi:MAG: LynF/TruF/PatF family peptide O-prenyltransferase, partial [Spirulina sp.]
FNLYSFHPSLYDYQLVFDFFRQVQGRADIKLDTRLPYQFIGSDLDFSKIRTIALGIDLRKEFNRSRLKFWVVPTNYSEKLEMAISLCEPNEEELKTLLLTKNALSVGFDIFLHGHTDIEVYLTLHAEQFQQVDVWQQLTQLLSPPALKLLEECWLLIIGFSKANPEKAIYYAPYNPNDFVANLGNDMANRVYASYRAHPLPMQHIIVALRESEILSGTIQNLNLYSSEQVYFKHPSGITKSRAALT